MNQIIFIKNNKDYLWKIEKDILNKMIFGLSEDDAKNGYKTFEVNDGISCSKISVYLFTLPRTRIGNIKTYENEEYVHLLNKFVVKQRKNYYNNKCKIDID